MNKCTAFTPKFLEECIQGQHMDIYTPEDVIVHYHIPEYIIRRNVDLITKNKQWVNISHFQSLSESFIREYKDYVKWSSICVTSKLSIKFMIEFADRLAWEEVCHFQNLTSEFMDQFAKKIKWDTVCKYQYLRPAFIEKHFKDLCRNEHEFEILLTYQRVTEKFLKENKKYYWNDNQLISKILHIKKLTKKFRAELVRQENILIENFIKDVNTK